MSAQSPATARPITLTPGSRVLDVSTPESINGRSPNFDETIWKRLRDAGFNEESIRRRDKAALIAYIAKLEAEIYDLQHNMGLLILERKDYASKYEESRLSAESTEVIHRRDQAALLSALAEAKKREENLKKTLGVEKECVANIEKALHEMRAECAEVKVVADSKLVEARSMGENAQRKQIEAEAKLRAAETLQEEARRCERAASRKLKEVEAREDDLRRRIVSFKSDCDAKEKEIMIDRQSLMERQRSLSEAQEKILDGQALVNQREADILSKSQALRKAEKSLEAEKERIVTEQKVLMEQKCNIELKAVSLSEQEKIINEKEALLFKKELDILASQEKNAIKEHIEVQRIIAEQENILKCRRDEFEAELLLKQKTAQEDIETKKRAWELREMDLKQREDLILEKEQDLEVQSRVITDKGKDLTEKIKALEEKENYLKESKIEIELTQSLLHNEREQFDQAKSELEKSLLCMEEEKKQTAEAKKELELMKSETSELLMLEIKLKEEIDMIRSQKQQLEAEAEKLKGEKAKFETEWESIDEKREEFQREEERIAGERLTISKFLKDERESLNMEKAALREQYKRDVESLSHDKETFRRESERERSEWFSKFQQERADLLFDIECRKRELEDSVNKRREEIESYLREKEKTFEEDMKKEIEHISSLKEDLLKEQDLVSSQVKKLEAEKLEIKLDREQREKAWAELHSLIEELQTQRLKLKEQRELLHADREAIHSQIEHLQKLEDIKVDSDRIVVPVIKHNYTESTPQVVIRVSQLQSSQRVTYVEDNQDSKSGAPTGESVSWLKKCTSLIFKTSPDKMSTKHIETPSDAECQDGKLGPTENEEVVTTGDKIRAEYETSAIRVEQFVQNASEEPKVIHEVPSMDDVPTSGRKRRVDDSPALDNDSMLLTDGKHNKKRRQENVDTSRGSQNVTPSQCMDLKQPLVFEDQSILSASSQSETVKAKAADLADEVERVPDVTPTFLDAEKVQNKVDKSGVEEDEALRCVILEHTITQDVLAVDAREVNKSRESKEKEDEERSDTDLDKQNTVGAGVRTRSKSKQVS